MTYHANHFSPVGYSFISCLNHFQMHSSLSLGFPCGSDGKESACNEGHLGSIPGLGTSPGEGNGNPLQYSCLENPHGQRRQRSHRESDTTERLSLSLKSLSPFALLYTLHHHPRVELFPSFQANITYAFQQLSIPLPQRLAPTVPLYINISAVETSKHRT